MANQNNNQKDKSVANSVKNTAGSAFEAVHNALETTENVAMSTVDAANKAAKQLTGNANNNQPRQ